MTTKDLIKFNEIVFTDPLTNRKCDGVEVIRAGRQVAVIRESARLGRAMSLSLEEVEDIIDNFTAMVNREPTNDEKEFWKAVRDFKHSQKQ